MNVSVVGAGLTGATIARLLTDAGHEVTIYERSGRVGGMCADEVREGILMCLYGGHLLHSDDEEVWQFLQRFCTIKEYHHRVLASVDGRVYQFPINMTTLMQVYECDTVPRAMELMQRDIIPCEDPQTIEDYACATVGRRLYKMFIETYTYKQWGIEANRLPASILKRIPLRTNHNPDYFENKYQGVPADGYTRLIENIIGDVPVVFNTLVTQENKPDGQVIYTGSLDEYFGYSQGILPYRSLRHDHKTYDKVQYAIATMQYPGMERHNTRTLEHRFFGDDSTVGHSVLTEETPEDFVPGVNERFYPMPLKAAQELHGRYFSMALQNECTPIGRLADYRYFDMDKAIKRAMDGVGFWLTLMEG